MHYIYGEKYKLYILLGLCLNELHRWCTSCHFNMCPFICAQQYKNEMGIVVYTGHFGFSWLSAGCQYNDLVLGFHCLIPWIGS